MSNITVAVLAPNGYADALGKKGTTSDITFYNLKKSGSTVTFIEPTRYPEKLSSLYYAISLADRILLTLYRDGLSPRAGIRTLGCHFVCVTGAYTATQGRYLAFIYYYTKLHGVPPAEADMQRYFKVSPPSVHNMIVTLERRRLIKRTPGASRSIQLLLGRDQLPDLE